MFPFFTPSIHHIGFIHEAALISQALTYTEPILYLAHFPFIWGGTHTPIVAYKVITVLISNLMMVTRLLPSGSFSLGPCFFDLTAPHGFNSCLDVVGVICYHYQATKKRKTESFLSSARPISISCTCYTLLSILQKPF